MLAAAVLLCAPGATQCSMPEAADNASVEGAVADLQQQQPPGRYNDIALYISGIKLAKTSGLHQLTDNPVWRQYASVTDSNWGSFSRTKIKKISGWAQAEIPDITRNCRTLLYPFSGPDFLYAHAFFPQAEAYILLGLEPVGVVPEPEKLQGEKSGVFFRMLDKSIADALTLSFFRTNDMADEINTKQLVTGTVPVLMLFLARTGNHITDIRFFDLSDNGTIAYREESRACNGNTAPRGAEIAFHKKDDARQRKLIYISADISDNGLARRGNVKAYLDRLDAGMTTYVKSASYLMHKNYFSTIRSLILRQSAAIVQDDSAIPYRFFKKELWDVRLYGAYTGPIDLFKVHLEKDLRDAYARDSKKLGFRLGYASQSNMLVARRIEQKKQQSP